jgi:hypothetical protein
MMACMGRTWLARLHPRRGRRVAQVACALISVLVLSGCPSDTDQPDEPPRDAALEIQLVGGADALTASARDELQGQVGDVLTAYVVAAFLGDYPRDDFVGSLESFTSGAAEKAAGDLDLLTASRYSEAEQVVARRLEARLNVFAAGDEPAGASARVRFRFAALQQEGEPRVFSMSGRLGLVPEGEGWRIFAYQVRRDDPVAGEAR